MTPADERRNLAIVYVNIALYALCYQLQRPVEPYGRDRGTAVRCLSKGGRAHYAHARCFNPPVSTGAVHRLNAWVCSKCNEGIAESRCIPIGVSHPQQYR